MLIVPYLTVWGTKRHHIVNNTGQERPISVDSTQKKPADTTVVPNIITKDSTAKYDSTTVADSIKPAKAGNGFPYKVSKDVIDDEVNYKANDSIVYDIRNKIVYLYGDTSKVHYKESEMVAYTISMDWNTNTLTGEPKKDTANEPIGDVVFKEKADTYYAKKLAYNFKTKKGKVTQARMKQDEGYIHLEVGKRNEYEEWYGKRGWYTTCDLEHPHFYIEAKKMKLVPNKVVVTGPANLVIHDVPTFLYVPFGIFPTKKGRRSGILLPQYGEEQVRGFYFRNGGYYFGISDNFDLSLTGDIYTKGSFGLHAEGRYVKRYRYNGSFMLQYARDRLGEPESPNFNIRNDFKVNWLFNQDPKAQPNSRFTANVNFGTATYDKSFSYTQTGITNSLLASKISYSRTWGNKPFSLGVNFSHDQNINTHDVNIVFPQLAFNVSRVNPFKRKSAVGAPKWYEGIGFSYSFETENIVRGVDSTFFRLNTFKNAKYGIKQSVPISTSFKVFKYFNLSPSFVYNERTYFQTVRKRWVDRINDTTPGHVVTDTSFEAKGSRDFSTSLALTTKVFGMYQFRNSKLKAIRHVITPNISFNYHPDFGKPFWGNYKSVQVDSTGRKGMYSVFEASSIYGDAPNGALGSLAFSVDNSLDMKVFSKKDTAKNEKKIALLESFRIGGYYNFIADSCKLSMISMSARTTLFDKFRVQMDMNLDPYVYDDRDVRVNRFLWNERHRLVSMRSASVSISTSLQSKKGGTLTNMANTKATEEEKQMVMTAPSLYYDFTIPWSINISYSLNISRGTLGKPDSLMVSANSIRLNLDLTITEKWKIALESGFDFKLNDVVYTRLTVIRNMHCWEMSFHWTPYPIAYQSYDMRLNVKSTILQDLKLSRKKSQFDSGGF